MTKKKDFSKSLKNYESKWVALSFNQKKIVSSSNNPKQALKLAIEKGEKNPLVFKVLNNHYRYF